MIEELLRIAEEIEESHFHMTLRLMEKDEKIKELESQVQKLERRVKKSQSRIFSSADIQKILTMHFFWGYSVTEIAKELGVSHQRISEVVNLKVTKGKDS